jgi:hypothetical protein
LAYSVPGSVPFADWDDYDLVMEASVGIRFQWNGTSVRIVSVKAEMLRDLPAWSVHAEAFSSKAEKRIQSGHIPVSRLLVRIWFNFLNWPSSSPKAILRKSIILDGSGKVTRYRGTWETRFKYQVN